MRSSPNNLEFRRDRSGIKMSASGVVGCICVALIAVTVIVVVFLAL